MNTFKASIFNKNLASFLQNLTNFNMCKVESILNDYQSVMGQDEDMKEQYGFYMVPYLASHLHVSEFLIAEALRSFTLAASLTVTNNINSSKAYLQDNLAPYLAFTFDTDSSLIEQVIDEILFSAREQDVNNGYCLIKYIRHDLPRVLEYELDLDLEAVQSSIDTFFRSV